MKFSIIIPAFNEEKMVARTLEAVLKQSYHDYEIIVVDNNSQDSTAAIVQDFTKKYPQISMVHCPTQGLLPARACGLGYAKGEIIVQLDADSVPRMHWLRNAAEHFSKNPNIVAAVGSYDYSDAIALLGSIQGFLLRYVGQLSQSLFFSIGNWYVQKRKFGALMIGGNAFIKKSALDAVGGYNLNHTFYNEDLVTISSIAKVGKVKFFKDLTVKTSARRHKEVGFLKLQKRYNVGTFDILCGRPITKQEEEYDHPH
jgi:glycosyltransferase involved in cell wall biosynthesis